MPFSRPNLHNFHAFSSAYREILRLFIFAKIFSFSLFICIFGYA
jgi:hypothetical protein